MGSEKSRKARGVAITPRAGVFMPEIQAFDYSMIALMVSIRPSLHIALMSGSS